MERNVVVSRRRKTETTAAKIDGFDVLPADSEDVHNLMCVVWKQIRIEGFLVFEYYHLYPKFLEFVLPHIKDYLCGRHSWRPRECPSSTDRALHWPQCWKTGSGSCSWMNDFVDNFRVQKLLRPGGLYTANVFSFGYWVLLVTIKFYFLITENGGLYSNSFELEILLICYITFT